MAWLLFASCILLMTKLVPLVLACTHVSAALGDAAHLKYCPPPTFNIGLVMFDSIIGPPLNQWPAHY